MSKINFRNSMIALAICLVMVSCGGRGGNQKGGDKKTAVEAANELVSKAEDKSVTADNWKEYVNKEFGIDFQMPVGWKFSKVRALNFSENNEMVLVDFERTDDNATKVSETARALFDRTQALSAEGNFAVSVSNSTGATVKGETFATFDEHFKPTMMYDGVSDIETYWYFKSPNGYRMVDVSAEKGGMRVKFEKVVINN